MTATATVTVTVAALPGSGGREDETDFDPTPAADTATSTGRRRVKCNPRTATLLLSVAACAVVLGTFAGLVPFPEISRATVNLLSDAIAVVNTLALALLVAGWYFIRHGQVDRHRLATVGATVLIVAFLATYLPKVGGEKAIGTPHNALYFAYLGMLAVHVLLSVFACRWWSTRSCSVSTHTPAELRTVHPGSARSPRPPGSRVSRSAS